MSHARLVGLIQHWLHPDSAVLGASAPWDSAVLQMYKDCTALDDEMDRRIGELLEGRRRSALDDCLKLIRAALPLCQLIEERSRALGQRPPSNMHLHALSAMGLALMKGARLGQPPSPALDASHRPAAEAAALARQQRRERPLSSAETLQLMSAVAATLAACAARLPAALCESIEMQERMLKAMPAVERAESAEHGRAGLQTSLLVPCCAADMLLRDMDIHAEAPHVQLLRQRTVTPQAVAEFVSAALEGAAVVQPRTGFEKPLWAELFSLLRRIAMPQTPADSEANAVLLGSRFQLLGAPVQPWQRRNAEHVVQLLLAFLRLPSDKPEVDTAQAIQEPAWRSSLLNAVELTITPQLLGLIARAGHLPDALQATALLLHRLPLKQPAGMAPADHAYLLPMIVRLACKLLLFSWAGSEGPQPRERQPTLQQVAGLLRDMAAAMGAVVEVHAVDLLPHAALAELELEHPATMAGIAVAHFQKVLMIAEFVGWGRELEAAPPSQDPWAAVAQLAAAAEALLRVGPKVQQVLPLLTDRRMLRPGGRTAPEIEGGSRSIFNLAGLVIQCLDQLLAVRKGRRSMTESEHQQAAAAWPAVHCLALSMGKLVQLSLEQPQAAPTPTTQPAILAAVPAHQLLGWLRVCRKLSAHCAVAAKLTEGGSMEALCAALSLAGPHRRLLLASGKSEDEAEQLSHKLVAQLLDCWFAVHGQPPSSERQQVEQLLRAQALSLRRCAHAGCTNLAGPSEACLQSKRCAGCGVARYCSPACQTSDWRNGAHKAMCSRLQAAAAAD